jgi:hypothetical protein
MNELEYVRQELVVTGNGVGFLLEELQSIFKEVKKTGTLSSGAEIRLQASCGFGSQPATLSVRMNPLTQKQTQERSQEDTASIGMLPTYSRNSRLFFLKSDLRYPKLATS